MNKILILITFLASIQASYAQKMSQESIKLSDLELNKKIVRQSLLYNDAQTAIASMHRIIAHEGPTSTYKDSLAITYFKAGNYLSSHLIAKELLKTRPVDIELLEINAISLLSLNATKEAIDAFEVLFAKTRNMGHGYQLALLQYGIKRLEEAQQTIKQVIACEPIEKAFLPFPIDKEQSQNIPLSAAVYNLKGLICYELRDNKNAIESFEEALKITPEFAVAKQNLSAIRTEKK